MGRIGSLLEVGTGFHPELTGRENVFLNGRDPGNGGRREVADKFDAVVAFAEIEKFIDTPVKPVTQAACMSASRICRGCPHGARHTS